MYRESLKTNKQLEHKNRFQINKINKLKKLDSGVTQTSSQAWFCGFELFTKAVLNHVLKRATQQ